MNYYWFNRQEILQKAKEKYSKEKAAENSSNKFFMLFLLTDNESLKFLFLINSTLEVSAYPLSALLFLEILISS